MAIIKIQPYIVDETQNFTFNNVTATGNIVSLNANLGNLATANYFSGSGANLTSIPGGNVTGAVAYATTANSVAVGNVSGIGNIATLNLDGNASNILYGNGTFAAAPAGGGYGNSNVATFLANYGSNTITTTGNVSVGNIIGNGQALTGVTGANVTGTVANATYATSAGSATTAGTVTTNAQSNITSVGTLTSLSVSGNANIGNIGTAGLVTVTGNVTAGNLVTSGALSVTGNANVGNIGATGVIATTITGSLTTASQPNITSVGTLTSLTVGPNSSVILSGTTGYVKANSIYGNDGTAALYLYYGNVAGAVGVRTDLTVGTSGTGNLVANTGKAIFGDAGNVVITGGSSGYVLRTDGAGNLSWVAQSGGGGSSISNGTSNVNIATSGGNVTTSVGGNANVVVVTGTGVNVAGSLSVSGTTNLGAVGNITITGGANGQVLTTNGSGVLSWANASAGTSGNVTVDKFTGNGSNVNFTLSVTPTSEDYTIINIDGAMQLHNAYSLTGNVVTFSEAPVSGAELEVITFALGGGGGGSTNAQDLLSPFLLMGA